LVLIESSPPLEVQGSNANIEPRLGTFDPEDAYGKFPENIQARPESQLARDQRKRGISVPEVISSTLVICGRDCANDRGHKLAEYYGAQILEFADFNHWDLVLRPEVPKAVEAFLRQRGISP
jgi:hypothetical protein